MTQFIGSVSDLARESAENCIVVAERARNVGYQSVMSKNKSCTSTSTEINEHGRRNTYLLH
jgi:hypothetical protein